MVDDSFPPKPLQVPEALKKQLAAIKKNLAVGPRFEKLAVEFPADPAMKKFNEAMQQRRQRQLEQEMEAEFRAREAQEAEARRAKGGRPPKLTDATRDAAIAMVRQNPGPVKVQQKKAMDFVAARGEPVSSTTVLRKIVKPARRASVQNRRRR